MFALLKSSNYNSPLRRLLRALIILATVILIVPAALILNIERVGKEEIRAVESY